MPHTRAARLRALNEASESRNILQMHDTNTNASWNDYSDWNLPGLTYQPDSLVWFPSGGAAADQPPFYDDAQFSTINNTNGLLETNYEQAPDAEFCGLQPWYSTVPQERSLVSSAAKTTPQLSASVFPSHESLQLDKGNRAVDETHAILSWSSEVERGLSSVGGGLHPQKTSDTQSNNLSEEVEEVQSSSSAEENERITTAKNDAHKKRKIAHSVIEKNYRSRIKDGMAELRHCVPSMTQGSPHESRRPDGQKTGNAPSNHSSGKVITLSDAVRHVKALERENAALHGQLDVMHRRNNALQKIALSKVDTQTDPATVAIDVLEQEDVEWGAEVEKVTNRKKRSRKPTPGRARYEVGSEVAVNDHVEPQQHQQKRSNAIVHLPSFRKGYDNITRNVIGTLAAIEISKD